MSVILVVCVLGVALAAHEITYKGTVLATETVKGKTTIRVSVINEKTRKPAPMTFSIDKETKILRGDTLMTYAEARIQKDEKVAVTIDHDFDESYAFVIRLDEKR